MRIWAIVDSQQSSVLTGALCWLSVSYLQMTSATAGLTAKWVVIITNSSNIRKIGKRSKQTFKGGARRRV